jgi:hypothetical protein
VGGGYPASGEWRVANGEWRVANGEWRVASGEWRVASGEWRVASGEWRMASGEWEDEESLVASPFAVRCSLFTADIRPISAGRDAPQTACRETRQPLEEGRRVLGSVPAF